MVQLDSVAGMSTQAVSEILFSESWLYPTSFERECSARVVRQAAVALSSIMVVAAGSEHSCRAYASIILESSQCDTGHCVFIPEIDLLVDLRNPPTHPDRSIAMPRILPEGRQQGDGDSQPGNRATRNSASQSGRQSIWQCINVQYVKQARGGHSRHYKGLNKA